MEDPRFEDISTQSLPFLTTRKSYIHEDCFWFMAVAFNMYIVIGSTPAAEPSVHLDIPSGSFFEPTADWVFQVFSPRGSEDAFQNPFDWKSTTNFYTHENSVVLLNFNNHYVALWCREYSLPSCSSLAGSEGSQISHSLNHLLDLAPSISASPHSPPPPPPPYSPPPPPPPPSPSRSPFPSRLSSMESVSFQPAFHAQAMATTGSQPQPKTIRFGIVQVSIDNTIAVHNAILPEPPVKDGKSIKFTEAENTLLKHIIAESGEPAPGGKGKKWVKVSENFSLLARRVIVREPHLKFFKRSNEQLKQRWKEIKKSRKRLHT